MNWLEFHAMAEEAELWSTLTINFTVLAGVIPAAIAYWRNLSPAVIAQVAVTAAMIGFGLAIIATIWMLGAGYGNICSNGMPPAPVLGCPVSLH